MITSIIGTFFIILLSGAIISYFILNDVDTKTRINWKNVTTVLVLLCIVSIISYASVDSKTYRETSYDIEAMAEDYNLTPVVKVITGDGLFDNRTSNIKVERFMGITTMQYTIYKFEKREDDFDKYKLTTIIVEE